MRREDKTKSAPGRRKKSETEQSNRAFLFSHLNQTKKTNNPKKTKSNLNSNTTRTEPCQSKSFTIESILSRKDPPKERLSTVDILSNLVNGIPVDDSGDESNKEIEGTSSSNSKDNSTSSKNSEHFSQESISSFEQRNRNPITCFTSSYNSLGPLKESLLGKVQCPGNPSEDRSDNRVGLQNTESAVERIRNVFDHTNFTDQLRRDSRQNESFVATTPPSLILVTNRSSQYPPARNELTERAGNHVGHDKSVSSRNLENGRSIRQCVVPKHVEKTLRLNERGNTSVIQETCRNERRQERATVICSSQTNSVTENVLPTENSRVFENYDPNHYVRSSMPCEPDIGQIHSLNITEGCDTMHDYGSQCNDFESFRTTSILTLRNRAEKHVKRLNVCS
jgi:hypothetical protein